MPRPRRRFRRSPSGGGEGKAVIIVSRYWPPPKLVRDLAMHCFGEAKVDLHVVEPPMDGDYVRWESVLKEVESLYYLHEGRVAVAVIPVGVETGFIVALREECEILGLKVFLALVAEEGMIRGMRGRSRRRVFGPRHRRYVYLGLSREWIVGVMPLDADLDLRLDFKGFR